MVRWFADADCDVNRWFKLYPEYVRFYKLDLGEAFFFENPKSDITAKHLSINSLMKLFALSKNLVSQLSIEKLIGIINFVIKLDPNHLRATGKLYVDMLGTHGEKIIESLLLRKEKFIEILPELTKLNTVSDSRYSLWNSPKRVMTIIENDVDQNKEESELPTNGFNG